MKAAAGATAMVHQCAGGVIFSATASCTEALTEKLARYVRTRCEYVLWPDSARQVLALLNEGRLTEGIALYFDRTGARWDQERLELGRGANGEHGMSNGGAADAGR